MEMKTYTARVRQQGESTSVPVEVRARNTNEARRQLQAQYGKNASIASINETR